MIKSLTSTLQHITTLGDDTNAQHNLPTVSNSTGLQVSDSPMLFGLKEYLDRSTVSEISLVSFMKRFLDIHDKDRIITTWRGSGGLPSAALVASTHHWSLLTAIVKWAKNAIQAVIFIFLYALKSVAH